MNPPNLSYLGAGLAPNTMPAATPGFGGPPPTPGLVMPPGAMGPRPSQGLPPGAIPGGPTPFMPPVPPGGPESSKYEAVTQTDGTVLLHLKNPDGSLGPAVKIINTPKPKGPQGPPGMM